MKLVGMDGPDLITLIFILKFLSNSMKMVRMNGLDLITSDLSSSTKEKKKEKKY